MQNHRVIRPFASAWIIAFLAGTIVAQPKMVIDRSEIDLGVVYNGGSTTTKVLIKNAGKDTLKIISIVPQCGCTAAKEPKKELLPGESDALEISFNSTGFRGKQTKYVSIQTNDPANSFAMITLKVNILEELEPTTKTSIFWLGTLPIGKTVEQTISFRNISTKPISIKTVSTTSPKLKVKANARSVSPSDSVTVTVTVTPEKEGYFHEQFHLETDSKNQPLVPMRVSFIGVKPS
jgi:hypothetical protein